MHLLNNQLCLYLILCLCTLDLPADHRPAVFAFKTNLFIEKHMQYISGISFFRLYFKSFKLLYAPKETFTLEEISEFKIIVLLF
jgi:hypothetical protein